jgi:hypothetical protein
MGASRGVFGRLTESCDSVALSAPSKARGVADEMPVRQEGRSASARREPARAWLLNAYRGSAGLEAVMTAPVLATPGSSTIAPSFGLSDPSAVRHVCACGESGVSDASATRTCIVNNA